MSEIIKACPDCEVDGARCLWHEFLFALAEQVFEIQMMDRTHRSQKSIAVQYGVSQKTIWRILNGKGWSA